MSRSTYEKAARTRASTGTIGVDGTGLLYLCQPRGGLPGADEQVQQIGSHAITCVSRSEKDTTPDFRRSPPGVLPKPPAQPRHKAPADALYPTNRDYLPITNGLHSIYLAADPMSVSRYPVVVFDLDGTLVRNTAVLAVLADSMGHGSAIAELEQRFRAGEISNRVIADTAADWFTGMDPGELWQHLEQAPWIAGIEATLETLLEAGCDVLLCTITWRFVAELIQRRYGFHAASGTEMDFDGGLLCGRVSKYFEAEDKVRFVESWCGQRGFTLNQVAAIGDSRLDVPLFSRVGYSIALNATPDARAAADCCLDTEDLTDVLELLSAVR